VLKLFQIGFVTHGFNKVSSCFRRITRRSEWSIHQSVYAYTLPPLIVPQQAQQLIVHDCFHATSGTSDVDSMTVIAGSCQIGISSRGGISDIPPVGGDNGWPFHQQNIRFQST
jgi:hypothetical protein